MLEDGKYVAWFKTALGQGTGVVTLAMAGSPVATPSSHTLALVNKTVTILPPWFAPGATAKVNLPYSALTKSS